MHDLFHDWKRGLGWLSDHFPIAFVVTGIIAVTAYIVTLALKATIGLSEDNYGYVLTAITLVMAPAFIGRVINDPEP